MRVDRLKASMGPGPSSAITGMTKKVAADQAKLRREATICPRMPSLIACSSAWMISPTTVCTSAQPAICPTRHHATERPYRTEVSSPWRPLTAAAASATLKKIATKVTA
jgi:hypothetical protein